MSAWLTASDHGLADEAALAAVRAGHPDYDVGFAGRYFAFRLTGGRVLEAGTPAELDAAIEADDVRLQFPNWRLWRSDRGRYWATRLGRRPRCLRFGFALTVDGDTPGDLREAIAGVEDVVDPGG